MNSRSDAYPLAEAEHASRLRRGPDAAISSMPFKPLSCSKLRALRSIGEARKRTTGIAVDSLRPVLAGQRPLAPGADRQLSYIQLNLGLFGYLKRVVNVNSEVTNSAFQLAMTE